MCPVSILGADTEIEQHNKNLMSFYYQTSHYHHFPTASCPDGYAVVALTLSSDVLSDLSCISIHGFRSFVCIFLVSGFVNAGWSLSCCLYFDFKLPQKTLRRIRMWRLASLSCEVTIMPLTFPAAVLPFAGI